MKQLFNNCKSSATFVTTRYQSVQSSSIRSFIVPVPEAPALRIIFMFHAEMLLLIEL